jgi:hypothetical protein
MPAAVALQSGGSKSPLPDTIAGLLGLEGIVGAVLGIENASVMVCADAATAVGDSKMHETKRFRMAVRVGFWHGIGMSADDHPAVTGRGLTGVVQEIGHNLV